MINCINSVRREVSQEEAQKLAQKYGFEYFETSAKTGENVDSVFETMANKVLHKIETSEIDPTQEVYLLSLFNLPRFMGLKLVPSELKRNRTIKIPHRIKRAIRNSTVEPPLKKISKNLVAEL